MNHCQTGAGPDMFLRHGVLLRCLLRGSTPRVVPRGRHGGRHGATHRGLHRDAARTGTANISGGPGRPGTAVAVEVAVEVAAGREAGCEAGRLCGASSEPSSSYLRLGASCVGLRAIERRISLRASLPQHTAPRLHEA